MQDYPGRDSIKDIAARLAKVEALAKNTAAEVDAVEEEVAELPDSPDFDPGDLAGMFSTKVKG